jgi:hypothetical protein
MDKLVGLMGLRSIDLWIVAEIPVDHYSLVGFSQKTAPYRGTQRSTSGIFRTRYAARFKIPARLLFLFY